MFDNRVCEMSSSKCSAFLPIWDCNTPMNVNDFDLHPEMGTPTATQHGPTEAIFVVVRSQISDYMRHCPCHLDFINPALTAMSFNTSAIAMDRNISTLTQRIENDFLHHCEAENPILLMTLHTARGFLAKLHLLEYYSQRLRSSYTPSASQHASIISHTTTMLQSDTLLMTSPLTKGYRWLTQSYFPFTAYMHLAADLRNRPQAQHVPDSWRALTDNFETHRAYSDPEKFDMNPIFKVFAGIVLRGWAAREKALTETGTSVGDVPGIVLHFRRLATEKKEAIKTSATSSGEADSMTDVPTLIASANGDSDGAFDWNSMGSFPLDYSGLDVFEQGTTDSKMDWSIFDWPELRLPPDGSEGA